MFCPVPCTRIIPSGKSTTRSSPWVPHRQPVANRGWLESEGRTLKTPEFETSQAAAIPVERRQSRAHPTAPIECHISSARPRLLIPGQPAYERVWLPSSARIVRLREPDPNVP